MSFFSLSTCSVIHLDPFFDISGSNLRIAHVHPVLTIIAYIFFFRMDNNHNIKIFSFV
jgi:hypothetical protein